MKKKKGNGKKIIFGADLEWATAQLYCKRMRIVLQYRKLYCSLGSLDGLEVYCNTLVCIAGWEACGWLKLFRNTV